MLELIIGGSGSGKSAFAEDEAVKLCGDGELIYLATMEPHGEEAESRIKRHRKARENKGFYTVELARDVQLLCDRLPMSDSGSRDKDNSRYIGNSRTADKKNSRIIDKGKDKGYTILLEALSSLLSNELFPIPAEGEKYTPPDSGSILKKILSGIREIADVSENLIIVSDDIFRDGIRYEKETEGYMRALALLHKELASMSDRVIEVSSGQALYWK